MGLVYYYLSRDISVTDVRVGRNGSPPASVSDFANLGSNSRVNNSNVKADVWLLPFLNLHAIASVIDNKSTTNIDVTLPPLTPNGNQRRLQLSVPTSLHGSVGGRGATLAGGDGPFFVAGDMNVARADLGFGDRFRRRTCIPHRRRTRQCDRTTCRSEAGSLSASGIERDDVSP